MKRPGIDWDEARRGAPVDDLLDAAYAERYGLDEAVRAFVWSIEQRRFHVWEAVIREEQGHDLTDEEDEQVEALISCSELDEPIDYIDEMPRPPEPWYETARRLVDLLPAGPYETAGVHFEVETDGWLQLADAILEYAGGLSLPPGVDEPLSVFPVERRHLLTVRSGCADVLGGLGQSDEQTLASEGQLWRVEELLEVLHESVDSLEFLGFSLSALLELIVVPPRDRSILVEHVLAALQLDSEDSMLAPALRRRLGG